MKLRLLAAAVFAAAVSLWAIPTGSAATIPYFEPLTTNVPYLAWRGEEIRLVKCATDATDGADVVSLMKGGISGDGSSRFNADWIVEDWSGQFFTPPQLEASTVKFFTGNNEYRGAPCVKADFVSLKAGLAQIKLVITDARTGNPVLKHQFLAGWLGLNTPSIKELSSTDQPGGGGVLGDPTGNGVFTAGGAPGRVQVRVTGNLPLGNNFSELGLGTSINLPTEADGTTSHWAELAQKMATTSDNRPFYRDAPWRMWDIHDDQAQTEGHVTAAPMCPGSAITALDSVDACIGAQLFIGDGEYSTAFGGRSDAPTFGPFDPLRPDETLLPDGKLDAGDVPMPSALVEVKIAPNTGSATDIGGVGSLAVIDNTATPGSFPYLGVFKCIPYSRDHKCTSNTGSHPATTPNVAPSPFGPAAHNHYAPFYSRWQPATFATVGSSLDDDAYVAREASGNDGPPVGNNFPGYRGSGLYDYWQFVDVLSEAQDGPTKCLQRTNPTTGASIFRSKPVGPQDVLVFSDEHGEAQAYFNPGTGFFFDNLVAPNGNGGCDLRGITTLGTADISAVARYPYQKVTDPDKPSGTIRKTVTSQFNKTVTCVPKSGLTGPETNTAFICTATAIDIDGTPLANERVCFTTGGTGAEVIFPFPLTAPAERLGDFTLCVRTNANGQAQVEIIGKCGTGNVFALFQDEGILRVFTFTFGCPTGGTTTTTTTLGTSTTTTTPSPGSPAPAGVISVPAAPQTVVNQVVASARSGSTVAAKPGAASPKATVTVIRIQKQLFAKQSARYVMVRVNSTATTARVQVTLVKRNGKTLTTVTRSVPTNRLVRVPNLKLPTAALHARVRVVS